MEPNVAKWVILIHLPNLFPFVLGGASVVYIVGGWLGMALTQFLLPEVEIAAMV